jgi:hypothetical protein
MPQGFIYASWIAARMLIGLFGCLLLYFGIFLYEPEDGPWQNRLDATWIWIHERARITDSIVVAVFNKIAELLVGTLDFLFGKLISFRAFVTSLNFSLATMFLFVMVVNLFLPAHNYYSHANVQSKPQMAWLCIRVSAFAFFCAFLPAWARSRWAMLVALLPIVFIAFVFAIIVSGGAIAWQMLLLQPFILVISCLLNFYAVVVCRKALRRVSTSMSLANVVSSIVALTAYAFGFILLPVHFVIRYTSHLISELSFHVVESFLEIGFLNIGSALLCLLPLIALAVLLVHKAFWPIVCHAIYPLARFEIVTNRKASLPIAGLCLTFAFNLEYVGWLAIIKLLH